MSVWISKERSCLVCHIQFALGELSGKCFEMFAFDNVIVDGI